MRVSHVNVIKAAGLDRPAMKTTWLEGLQLMEENSGTMRDCWPPGGKCQPPFLLGSKQTLSKNLVSVGGIKWEEEGARQARTGEQSSQGLAGIATYRPAASFGIYCEYITILPW